MHALNLILAALYYVIAVLTVVHVVMDNRQPAKTMAWALVIWFVPVVGIVLYLFFGVNTRKERLISKRSLNELSKRSMPQMLPCQSADVTLYSSGYDYFPALLEAISTARHHIHISMYIFEDDALGNLMADALIDKARQGVEVRVIYDDVGCWRVPHRFFERMREEGIEVVPFLPVRFPTFTSKVNYRNHRKLVVVDGRQGFIGGMNIARRYVKGIAGRGEGGTPWRDTMVRITGPAVSAMQRAFLIDWYFVDRTLINDRQYYPTALPAAKPTDSSLLNIVSSGPDSPLPEIMQGYVRIITAARRYVYIETPYFMPTEPVLFALKTAAAAGVDVRIMVPLKNDSWIVEMAGRSFLRGMQKAGARVELYTAGFLHSKLMVCDDVICTCGSTNIDFRSFENNFETNAFFQDSDTAMRMKALFMADEAQSTPWQSLSSRMKPSFLARLTESLLRMLAPLM